MASVNNLKQDIKTLEALFPKNHELFQVTAASVDELTCSFINRNGKKFDIHANITETYPSTPPMWFAETEDQCITSAVQILSNTSGRDNLVLQQVKLLVSELCRLHNIREPIELISLQSTVVAQLSKHDEETKDDIHIEIEEDTSLAKGKKDGISSEHTAIHEQQCQNQRQDYLRESVSGSGQATDRLMKEFGEVYRSESFKKENPFVSKHTMPDLLTDKRKWRPASKESFDEATSGETPLKIIRTVCPGATSLTISEKVTKPELLMDKQRCSSTSKESDVNPVEIIQTECPAATSLTISEKVTKPELLMDKQRCSSTSKESDVNPVEIIQIEYPAATSLTISEKVTKPELLMDKQRCSSTSKESDVNPVEIIQTEYPADLPGCTSNLSVWTPPYKNLPWTEEDLFHHIRTCDMPLLSKLVVTLKEKEFIEVLIDRDNAIAFIDAIHSSLSVPFADLRSHLYQTAPQMVFDNYEGVIASLDTDRFIRQTDGRIGLNSLGFIKAHLPNYPNDTIEVRRESKSKFFVSRGLKKIIADYIHVNGSTNKEIALKFLRMTFSPDFIEHYNGIKAYFEKMMIIESVGQGYFRLTDRVELFIVNPLCTGFKKPSVDNIENTNVRPGDFILHYLKKN